MAAESTALAAARYVRAFSASLHAGGVRHVVICAGSRSTPLTLTFARDPAFRCWLQLDERSAGYFALGLARQLREPVALVCTSGTAAANFLPAAVEASLSRVPLVFLTADRPPELREVGAAQTIDQLRLFGSHVRWSFDMPVADGSPELERHAAAIGARAAAVASDAPSGPVHINFPFREPLTAPADGAASIAAAPPVEVWREAPPAPDPAVVRRLATEFTGTRGLIICGPQSFGLPAEAIAALGAALRWPVLADPLSGLRAGTHPLDDVIDAYDSLVRDERFASEHAPEVTLRFGAAPTSKALNEWLAALAQRRSVVVDAAGGWRDPDASASAMVGADPAAFCEALLARLLPHGDRSWIDRWTNANRLAAAVHREAIDALEEPFEGAAATALADALPDGSTLVCGNSMPVRDIDSFFGRVARDVRIVGTRGASGIDGVVSTAVGAATAGGGPVVLLVGDLSFLHDLNGLWPVRRYGLNLTIVLVNNNGGGIFHFLPQAQQASDLFEQWFGTSHDMDLRAAVQLHRGTHGRLDEVPAREWSGRIVRAMQTPGLHVLELQTDRERNVQLHREVWAHVSRALREGVQA